MRKIGMLLFFCGGFIFSGFSQEEMEDVERDYENFKALKMVNLESTKIAEARNLYFNVGHRFGSITGGLKTFFGLDQSNTKIQMLYGIADYVQIGLSRESIRKTYSGSLKFRILKQRKGLPISMTGYTSIHANTELSSKQFPKMVFYDRLSYLSQLLISSKLGNHVTLELAPSYIRQNLVLEPFQKHDQFAVGAGARFQVSKKFSINLEYAHNFSRADASIYKNPIGIGFDLETYGHVFQLVFSNAQPMSGPGYMTNAEGDITKGDFYFGFNITRSFEL